MKQRRTVRVGDVALRQLCEEVLAGALAALQRQDREALHDCRVALRRLYVLVKQLAQPDKQRKRVLRSIKALLTQSNRGRDAQVMLTWLELEWPRLGAQEVRGARHWQQELERRVDEDVWPPIQVTAALKQVMPFLATLTLSESGHPWPLALFAAHLLEQQIAELTSLLKGAGVADELHLIRLQAKTVRYLLLPFCGEGAACTRALQAMQRLQTQLGEWHDAVVRQQNLNDLLRKELVAISRDDNIKQVTQGVMARSPCLPGLLALARSSYHSQQRRVAFIERHYLHDGGAHLVNLLHQAIAQMRKAATAHG
ncbi:MAG TPA: CHAD domain-containing protein [Gammaproteobacteria bacterium]